MTVDDVKHRTTVVADGRQINHYRGNRGRVVADDVKLIYVITEEVKLITTVVAEDVKFIITVVVDDVKHMTTVVAEDIQFIITVVVDDVRHRATVVSK